MPLINVSYSSNISIFSNLLEARDNDIKKRRKHVRLSKWFQSNCNIDSVQYNENEFSYDISFLNERDLTAFLLKWS